MLLKEIFDKPAKYRWIKKTPKVYSAEFVTKEHVAYIVYIMNYGENWTWTVIFEINLEDNSKEILDKVKQDSMGIVGTGRSQEVFSTVIKIIKDFIKQEKPEQINFDAKEPSRMKLYAAIIKKLANGLGYTLHKDNYGMYELVRK